MRLAAYYNEIDPYAAQWIRNLMKAGHVTDGEVDERSITEVAPDDVEKFARVHLFAGIAVWDHALGLAGWPADRPVWTASCPCQPFSDAGKKRGADDERHLWPEARRLVRECRPAEILGEQVASKDGRDWLCAVQADLEADGYAFGAADLCAAGAGAPHIRQRLWWYAHDTGSADDGLADGIEPGLEGYARHGDGSDQSGRIETDADGPVAATGGAGRVDKPASERHGAHDMEPVAGRGQQPAGPPDGAHVDQPRPTRPTDGFWRDADWLFCRDGKWRPVEPGTQPLAHGVANRVGKLRAYGNAIVAPLAAEFIEAVLHCRP